MEEGKNPALLSIHNCIFFATRHFCRDTLELFFPVVPRTITWHIKTRFRSQEPPQVFSASLPHTSQHSSGDRDPWIPHKNTHLPLTEASDAHFWRRVFFTPCNKRGKHCRRSLFFVISRALFSKTQSKVDFFAFVLFFFLLQNDPWEFSQNSACVFSLVF